MISFKCRCGTRIQVNDDQAGDSLQCPQCHLAVDVPALDDLEHLDEDGNLKFADDIQPVQKKLADNRKLPGFLEHEGNDRRMSVEEFLNIGIDEKTLSEIKGEVRPGVSKTPRYDPITGELLVPLDLVETEKVIDAGVAQPIPDPSKTLGYARNPHAVKDPGFNLLSPFWLMFRAENVIVMFVLVIACLFAFVLQALPLLQMFSVVLLTPLMFMLILGHLGNVLDETGPNEKDDMPTLLRGVSFSEDIWRPFVQVFLASMVAILPFMVASIFFHKHRTSDGVVLLLAALALFAYAVWPAALLTSVCSGTLNNMLPNRMLGTIPVMGFGRYVLITLVLTAGLHAFVYGVQGFMGSFQWIAAWMISPAAAVNVATRMWGLPLWGAGLAGTGLLVLGIYLLHVGVWQLGLVYRKFHKQFPWVLQVFEKTDRTDTLARLRDRRFPKTPKRS
jgi:hypothetical protein